MRQAAFSAISGNGLCLSGVLVEVILLLCLNGSRGTCCPVQFPDEKDYWDGSPDVWREKVTWDRYSNDDLNFKPSFYDHPMFKSFPLIGLCIGIATTMVSWKKLKSVRESLLRIQVQAASFGVIFGAILTLIFLVALGIQIREGTHVWPP